MAEEMVHYNLQPPCHIVPSGIPPVVQNVVKQVILDLLCEDYVKGPVHARIPELFAIGIAVDKL